MKDVSMSRDQQIIIIGSGVVGLACAAVLAQRHFSISVLGETPLAWDKSVEYGRVYALNALSRSLLVSIGVWDAVRTARVYPYYAMRVFDDKAEIHFDATDLALSELGFIVEDLLLRKILFEHLGRQPNVRLLCPAKLAKLERRRNRVHIKLSDGRTLDADLVIGADGMHSVVRDESRFSYRTVNYQQQAFTATIETRQLLHHTCRQWFHSDGILALLPVGERRASIVWSCNYTLADKLTEATDAKFAECLNQVFSDQFGPVLSVSARAAFPLYGGIVDKYTMPGVVLVGDAAHCIHPLAGQGANMGFADIDCLQQVLAGRNFHYVNLRRYERAVKGRNLAMKLSLEGIKHIFGSQIGPVMAMRRHGLRWVNHCLPLKISFMRQALG